MKQCSRCHKLKNIAQFSKKGDGLQPFCRECNSKYLKQHYNKNKQYYKDKSKNHSKKLRKITTKIKTETACKDCKKFYHFSQMQFDHLRDKSFGISNVVGTGAVSINELMEEIKKCEVVCASHAYRTWKRNNITKCGYGIMVSR